MNWDAIGALAELVGAAAVVITLISTSLEGANRVRYYTWSSNLLRVYENAFLQKRENAMDNAHWEGMTRMMIDVTKMAAFDDYWKNRKYWLSTDFQLHMESEIILAENEAGITIPGNY
jgi:hypothetical protein